MSTLKSIIFETLPDPHDPRCGLHPGALCRDRRPCRKLRSAGLQRPRDCQCQAIAEIGNRPQPEQQICVYLDGCQLSDAVTRYQRRDNRANGE